MDVLIRESISRDSRTPFDRYLLPYWDAYVILSGELVHQPYSKFLTKVNRLVVPRTTFYSNDLVVKEVISC